MPHEPPQDLAHARWRVRFFKHLVEEHRMHQYPQERERHHWAIEDAAYVEHLSQAEAALADMEAAKRRDVEGEVDDRGGEESAVDWVRRGIE